MINFEEANEPAEAGLEGVGPQLSEVLNRFRKGDGTEQAMLELSAPNSS